MSSPSARDQSISRTVEALYAAFASNVRAPLIPFCECCTFTDLEASLSSAPLREVAPTALLDYFHYALTNCGPLSTFKHFLPRIVELIAAQRSFSTAVLANKLSESQVSSWSGAEQQALHAALSAILAARPTDRGLRHAVSLLKGNDEGTRGTGSGA